MSTAIEQVDLAQRVAAVLTSTSVPRQTAKASQEVGAVVIGTVPLHLRHLHNLMYDLYEEINRSDVKTYLSRKRSADLVNRLFYTSLQFYYPVLFTEETTILTDWRIVQKKK